MANRVAIVTGGGSGIGAAAAAALAEAGLDVAVVGRRPEPLERLAASLPGRAVAVPADVGDVQAPEAIVARVLEELGRVDVLVNNVGAAHVRLDGFLSLSDGHFEASLQLNLFAALRATRAAVQDMAKRREGAIVNVASVNSFFEPDGGVIDYGVAKAALVNLAKSLSQELGPSGIRITSVSPGPVATDLWLGGDGVAETVGRATGEGADAVRERMAEGMPTGRFTTPREVATVVALLASPRMSNVTGANWVIDGGLVKTT